MSFITYNCFFTYLHEVWYVDKILQSHIQACHYIKQITKFKMLEVIVVVVVFVYKVNV